MNFFKKIVRYSRSIIEMMIVALPNDPGFSRLRVWWWRLRGFDISRQCWISRGVYLQGRITIGGGSSVANNCLFNGMNAGINIGRNVMIAPNCVIVAFNHPYERIDIPMSDQTYIERPICVEDDVWIAANCTITCGVHIGRGSVVAANSLVTRNVKPYTIVGGVPAEFLWSRRRSQKLDKGVNDKV